MIFKRLGMVPLKWVCFAGLFLSLFLGGGLILAVLHSGASLFTRQDLREENTFYRDLREYDALLAGRPENSETLSLTLDRLEKKALGVESHLAVLKRRRALAFRDPRFNSPYQKATQRSAAAFPYSQPLAAVALEALLREAPGFDRERVKQMEDYTGRISETRLMPLVLACYILSGAMKDPASAAALPNREALLTFALPLFSGELSAEKNEKLLADLTIDLTLLRILDGDLAGASAGINDLLSPSLDGKGAAPEIQRFAAEFFYNYGNPRRAAELLARFSDAGSLARQADALWLADIPGGARNIWTVLTAPHTPGQADTPPEIRARSLYNLAASAPDKTEAAAWLNRLLAEGRQQNAAGSGSLSLSSPGGQGESSYVYGIIRYTRLLDGLRAQAILEEGELRNHPLLDLELLRRRRETWPVDRLIAETWLLLGRHPEDRGLYQWAAYFFDYQRRYEETVQALKNAGYHNLDGYWAELHRALAMIREGRYDEGEKLLKTIPPSAGIWQAPANTGRILEARRSPAAAMEYYETAAAMVKNGKAAAGIQLRIAQCLRALGRDRESRRVLEYALDLDPENLNARLELRRLDSLGIY
jgi:tetratricopeptide (TPR) repeat protein